MKKLKRRTLYGQLFAQAGYVVWELDNRGMGNRGKAFCAALYEHMGGVEVQDQLTGVDYLKTLPYVDPARIGLLGHSEGGMIAPLVAARSSQPAIAFVIALAGPGRA